MKIRKKSYIDKNVYEKTIERIKYLYESFDDVIVSFSGGKDSTAMLNCCIEVAREIGRLPVKAVFFDEEAIHPPTIEYVRRVMLRDDVALTWFCLPVKHRNACSNEQPFWYCWDESCRDKWIREIPEWATTTHKDFKPGMAFQDFCPLLLKGTNNVLIQGIRTEESLRRFRAVANKKNDNYITRHDTGVKFAYPIYDWSSSDVWTYVRLNDCDYNRTYDIFNRTSFYNKLLTQRVCPPFGEEPLRGLWVYAECFPEMWHKMLYRVEGVATAWRYANTDIYSKGAKPDGVTWKEHINNVLESYGEDDGKSVSLVVDEAVRQHKKKTNDDIPDDDGHPLSGCSWAFIAKIVTRGDFKGRVIQGMQQNGEKTRARLGITLQQAEARYGKKKTAAR